MSQTNKDRKPNEAKTYYFTAFITATGEVVPLLLTEFEFKRASVRAENNPEDLWADFLVLQEKITTVKDPTK